MFDTRNDIATDSDLLDAEVWDAPARLSAADCLTETGPDWRWTDTELDHGDDR